ncbi:Lnb N-terminal periplasmic domain-containing protein [Acetobacter sp.]|jgi:hypothetical protein|uniref:Lnb N-terminal periplasmic domain-containing protein n=1 Tax=Acetobacter sp. TaxID=440 RepID=UPI0025C5C570|nr:DUF4105 domain-containing protein [Acetobacter sp.]MCH4092505.1 DUF4105 domain-containing protein [Acetobacter sp.]MCI1299639.1 DUF4105 domain-containing protein [Acetobacter sp.]MCI1315481.1 DUF4105 domain-containing protein [Acetobacter sp.]
MRGKAGRWFCSLACGVMLPFTAAAFWYSTILPDWLRIGLALLFPAFFLVCLLWGGKIRLTGCAILMAGFWGWYLTDPPRNDRIWAGEYAVPADARVDGTIAHVSHIRNFTYKTETDYKSAYYDADYDLDRLSGMDLVTSYWAGDAIAHVFLSFSFSDGRHLAISIETRRQKRFSYSTIAGFFHHYELFYVTADERDLIGVRTDIRKERVYLYHLQLAPATERRLFLSYLAEIHALNTQPRWYNTLTDNCTTGILQRADARWRYRLDWRVLLSGYTASLAYDLGFLDHRDNFATLQNMSLIRRPEGSRPDADYSREIWENRP